MRKLLCLAAALIAAGPALARDHFDADPGYKLSPTAPIYIYVSTGPSEWAKAVTTNTTLNVPAETTVAQICVETAGVRYTDDGTSASAANGIPVVPASATLPNCFTYSGPIASLKFTAISGSPTISVSYYRAK